jgi:2-polyprenyl-3-methyl-5-hydroxy-6-metoxy-1,4-benzoquinol methylase
MMHPGPTLTSGELLRALASIHTRTGLVDRLKVKLRPLICPFEDVLAQIPPGQYVCDIGCGSGQFSWLVARYCRPSAILGLEVGPLLVANARALFAQHPMAVPATFLHFDGRTLPTAAAGADVVVMIDVWHHVPLHQRSDLLASIVACMKPGAILLFKDIDASSPFVVANKVHDLIFGGGVGHEISTARAKELLTSAGLLLQGTYTRRMHVYPHYLLVARK